MWQWKLKNKVIIERLFLCRTQLYVSCFCAGRNCMFRFKHTAQSVMTGTDFRCCYDGNNAFAPYSINCFLEHEL